MGSETQQKKKGLEYKWVIVAVSFLMVFMSFGFCSSNKGLYLSAITDALGIKRSLFSINDSFRYISTSIVNLFFGMLIEKYGARKMIGVGFASLTMSMLIYAHATSIWMFYVGGCFLGIGLTWCGTTMVGYVVNCWCKEHKGTIMGIILAANGLGGALAAQIITPIIYEEGNAFGYRNAYRLVAVIILVVGIIVVTLFRNAPNHAKENIPKKQAKGNVWNGVTFEQAIRKPYFYTVVICIFLTGAVLQGISGISAAHMKDIGLDAGYVAMVVSIHSLVLSASKFLTGVAYDRFGIKVTVLFCDIAAVVAFLGLALITPTTEGKVFAMIYAIFSSFALPLETIMLPLISGELFGQISFAKMMGIVLSVNTVGFAVGAPLANLFYDIFGTYKPMLIGSAVIMILVAIEFQRILFVVKKEKEQN